MLLKKGNTIESILSFFKDGDFATYHDTMNLSDVSPEMKTKLCEYVSDVIKDEKRGHLKFTKCVQRIEHHLEQLTNAYNEIVDSYMSFVTPHSRRSSKTKTQYDMLSNMPDKMLRQYAHAMQVSNADDFVLPDERESLIDSVVEKLNE